MATELTGQITGKLVKRKRGKQSQTTSRYHPETLKNETLKGS
jgi:hypothetical protein